MGGARLKQERLAEKLLQVRLAFRLSQQDMHRRLDVEDIIPYNRISDYELGKRDPPLAVLLKYARAANVYVDALIDDELDLPDQLPSLMKHEGVKRNLTSRRRSKQ
jgi:transcriptional regulator with XRE-family HTH domain